MEDAESGRWDEFVAGAERGHMLQGWAWGEFKRRHGWRPVRLALFRDERIVAGAQVLIRSLFGVSMAYVPRGPVPAADAPHLDAALLDAIHRLARARHSIFLKVEPNEAAGTGLARSLRDRGFVKSPHTVQPRATLMLGLEGGEDAVWQRLPGKTRYHIRLAEKRGVRVRAATDGPGLERFHELMRRTGERGEFAVRSMSYYRDVLREFEPRGQARLLLAEVDGRVIAGMMAFAYGRDGVYMYAASDDEHKRSMPNYLLQWHAIRWAIERGCVRYDLWGIPERAAERPEERPSEETDALGPLWGVYRFKRRFGDRLFVYAGAYDYPYIRPLYLAWAHLRKNKEM